MVKNLSHIFENLYFDILGPNIFDILGPRRNYQTWKLCPANCSGNMKTESFKVLTEKG